MESRNLANWAASGIVKLVSIVIITTAVFAAGITYIILNRSTHQDIIPECICTCDGNSAQLTIEPMIKK